MFTMVKILQDISRIGRRVTTGASGAAGRANSATILRPAVRGGGSRR
jgi:hypothetical protein